MQPYIPFFVVSPDCAVFDRRFIVRYGLIHRYAGWTLTSAVVGYLAAELYALYRHDVILPRPMRKAISSLRLLQLAQQQVRSQRCVRCWEVGCCRSHVLYFPASMLVLLGTYWRCYVGL